VLECLKDYRRLGIWLEVTTLVIPGHNDSRDELRRIADFISGELGAEVPWHISAFYPTYKMHDRPPTSLATLLMAREIGRESGLHYVYLGNVNQADAGDTICPGCGQTVIRRRRLQFIEMAISDQQCQYCQHAIAGVGLGT
jgi:pyruvate formate lyase activating enzyme